MLWDPASLMLAGLQIIMRVAIIVLMMMTKTKMTITMANLAVLLFKLSQDSLLKTEYGLSPLHSCELPTGRFNNCCSSEFLPLHN